MKRTGGSKLQIVLTYGLNSGISDEYKIWETPQLVGKRFPLLKRRCHKVAQSGYIKIILFVTLMISSIILTDCFSVIFQILANFAENH